MCVITTSLLQAPFDGFLGYWHATKYPHEAAAAPDEDALPTERALRVLRSPPLRARGLSEKRRSREARGVTAGI